MLLGSLGNRHCWVTRHFLIYIASRLLKAEPLQRAASNVHLIPGTCSYVPLLILAVETVKIQTLSIYLSFMLWNLDLLGQYIIVHKQIIKYSSHQLEKIFWNQKQPQFPVEIYVLPNKHSRFSSSWLSSPFFLTPMECCFHFLIQYQDVFVLLLATVLSSWRQW